MRPGDEVLAGLAALVAGVEHEQHGALAKEGQVAQ
jgi:hypothetical protein